MKLEKKLSIVVFLTLLLVALSTCVKDNTDDRDDIPLEKKDSISLKLISALNSDSIKATVTWLQNMGTRFALADNRRQVAVRIRDKFKGYGYYTAYIDSFLLSNTWRSQNFTTWQYNVVAQLNGSVHPDSLSIIGAHYDSNLKDGDPFKKAPGANDNGSGVAAMFEIARVMKLKNYIPDISIQFVAFAAEEVGLFGSADYAGKLAYSGRPVSIMINNDMIANVSNPNMLLWGVKIKHYSNSEDLSENASALCNKYIKLTPVVDTSGIKRSDSYSFFLKNFKAIYFESASTDYNYHTTGDLVVECNFNYCKLITGLSAAMLVHSD